MSQEKIMYVCETCAKSSPESCGHYDRSEVRVSQDGRWLCNDCYDEDAIETSPAWHDLPPAPEYAPR